VSTEAQSTTARGGGEPKVRRKEKQLLFVARCTAVRLCLVASGLRGHEVGVVVAAQMLLVAGGRWKCGRIRLET
jgi:hypothetical protein